MISIVFKVFDSHNNAGAFHLSVSLHFDYRSSIAAFHCRFPHIGWRCRSPYIVSGSQLHPPAQATRSDFSLGDNTDCILIIDNLVPFLAMQNSATAFDDFYRQIATV